MRRLLIALALLATLAGCGSAASTASPVASPAVTATPSPVAETTPTPAPTEAPTVAPTVSPTEEPTPEPTAAPPSACLADQLTGAVVSWEGAAGHQIASVVITANGDASCVIQGTPQLQLVDSAGSIVIDSVEQGDAGLAHVADGDPAFLLGPGEAVRTLVSVANYCANPAPSLPTTIAMILPADGGRLVLDPGPGGDVPACMSSPGSAGQIEMSGWSR